MSITWVGRDNNQPTKLFGASGAMTIYQRYLANQTPTALNLVPPVDIADMGVDYDGNFVCSGGLRVLPVWTSDPQSLCQQSEMQQQPSGNPFDQSSQPQQQPQQQPGLAGIDGSSVTISWVGRDIIQPTKLYGASGAMSIYQRYLANPTATLFAAVVCVTCRSGPAIRNRCASRVICSSNRQAIRLISLLSRSNSRNSNLLSKSRKTATV